MCFFYYIVLKIDGLKMFSQAKKCLSHQAQLEMFTVSKYPRDSNLAKNKFQKPQLLGADYGESR